MQLNLTTDYAIRVLVYLAERKGTVCSASEMSERLHVTRKYLIRISTKLRDAGFLVTYPGNVGGYSLGKPAEEIRLYDVVLLMEGTVKLHRCLEPDRFCSRGMADSCRVHQCFEGMQKCWEDFLTGVTVADLADGASDHVT